MKTVWTVLSVLAIANLIALAGLLGWLAKSDRLNMDRVRAVREAIIKPIAQEKSELDLKAKAEDASRAQAQAEAKASKPPLTAAEKLQARIEATELDRQRLERLKREVSDLQKQLATDRARLERERTAFATEKKAFEDSVASTTVASSDAQFQKTLKVLVGQKPQQAVTLLMQMLAAPAPAIDLNMVPVANGATLADPAAPQSTHTEQGMATVVGYLDAMSDKPRGKIMEALTKTDPKLAADLLERLRTRGEFARVP
jgi:hypothetical protein